MYFDSVKVEQYDMDGKLIREYESIGLAARENDFSPDAVSRCIRGERKSAYGYTWRSSGTGRVSSPFAKPVERVEEGKVVETYLSIKEGAQAVGVGYRTFRTWLQRGKNGWRMAS